MQFGIVRRYAIDTTHGPNAETQDVHKSAS